MTELNEANALFVLTGDLLSQAEAARAVKMPQEGALPHAVHATLVLVRSRLDTLEVVLSQAMDLKHGTAMEAARLEQAAEDAWDEKADSARRQGLRAEYEGAQERYATWRLQTRDERALARYARQNADMAAHCEARVRLAYRGLDNARLDLHQRLRALAFEASLERT